MKAKTNKQEVSSSYHQKAGVLTRKKRYLEAIEWYDKSIHLNPLDYIAWHRKGIALREAGQFEESIRCCDKAIKINPKDHYAWNHKGLALSKTGNVNEALKCHNMALEINPKYVFAAHAKGLLLGRLSRHQEAISCFEYAISINRKDHFAWHRKGINLRELGKFEEAMSCYDTALRINKTDHFALNHKGRILGDIGRYTEALECIKQALNIDKRYIFAWCCKGNVLLRLSRIKEAQGCFLTALKISPQYPEALRVLAEIQSLTDNSVSSITDRPIAFQLNLENPLLLNTWSNIEATITNNSDVPISKVSIQGIEHLDGGGDIEGPIEPENTTHVVLSLKPKEKGIVRVRFRVIYADKQGNIHVSGTCTDVSVIDEPSHTTIVRGNYIDGNSYSVSDGIINIKNTNSPIKSCPYCGLSFEKMGATSVCPRCHRELLH